MDIKKIFRFDVREVLTVGDFYTLVMLSIYTVLALIFFNRVQDSLHLILFNLFIAAGIISITTIAVKFNAGTFFTALRWLYVIPLILFIYTQVQYYIRVVNPHLFDGLLMSWDRAIFGINPTDELLKISTAPLTEYLQICYMTYFIMPFLHGMEIYLRKDQATFENFASLLLFSFYASYLLYFIMPAIGPRFTLHNYFHTSLEMPGLWLTDFLRNIVDVGGGVVPGTINPSAIVNRDCMPSGHTWITLVNIITAWRLKSKLRYPIFILGFSLIFATVYLRYHYVVDVIAGASFAMLSVLFEPRIRKLVNKLGVRGSC